MTPSTESAVPHRPADSTSIRLRGARSEVEIAIRRAARALQWAIALPIALLLWWFGAVWWVPLPIALSFLLHDALLRPRRDDALSLELGETSLRLFDPTDDRAGELDLSEIAIAKVIWRRRADSSEAMVVLADRQGPRLALRFLLQRAPVLAEGDIDLDAADVLLGGQGGGIRSFAPIERIARQHFEDPRGLAYLRTQIPAECWQRTAIRLWQGPEPALDTAGHHQGDPEHWLVLDGPRWVLYRYDSGEPIANGTIETLLLGGASRTLQIAISATRTLQSDIPLLGIDLGSLRIWFPALSAAPRAAPSPIEERDHHTHPAEGASLFAHLERVVPEMLRRAMPR